MEDRQKYYEWAKAPIKKLSTKTYNELRNTTKLINNVKQPRKITPVTNYVNKHN